MSKFRGILNDDCCEYLSTSLAAEEFRNSVDIGEVAGESVVYCGRWQPSMQSRVYATGARPSVCLSLSATALRCRGLLLWARRPGDADRLLHGRRSAAAEAPQHGAQQHMPAVEWRN